LNVPSHSKWDARRMFKKKEGWSLPSPLIINIDFEITRAKRKSN
jgi:hypothetical protein